MSETIFKKRLTQFSIHSDNLEPILYTGLLIVLVLVLDKIYSSIPYLRIIINNTIQLQLHQYLHLQ